MECDQCGAPRPRTGRCPECGAPPPRAAGGSPGGSRSSMRNWRQSSGDDWGQRDPGGSGRGSRQGRGGAADAWDSGSRGRRRGGYEEEDLGRALVPQAPNQGMMSIPEQGAAMIPASAAELDDVDRAMGVRRPVYIPAIGDKPKVKPRTWRVLSGVLSVLLMCVASCAAAGVLGHSAVQRLFPSPVKALQTPVTIDYSAVPATPVATAGTAGTYIRNVVTSTAHDAGDSPVGITSHFLIGQAVNVVLTVRGVPKGQHHTVTVHWFLQGNDLHLENVAGMITSVDISQDQNAYFVVNYPVAGVGTAKIYWDLPKGDNGDAPNDPHLAATISFGIYQPTPTAPSSKTPTTPGKTPVATTTKTK